MPGKKYFILAGAILAGACVTWLLWPSSHKLGTVYINGTTYPTPPSFTGFVDGGGITIYDGLNPGHLVVDLEPSASSTFAHGVDIDGGLIVNGPYPALVTYGGFKLGDAVGQGILIDYLGGQNEISFNGAMLSSPRLQMTNTHAYVMGVSDITSFGGAVRHGQDAVLPTCNAAAEGASMYIAGTGGSPTKNCFCRSDGNASPTYQWCSLAISSAAAMTCVGGSSTVCP